MRCGSLLIGITLIAVLAGCQGPRRTAVEAQDAAVAWMIEHQNPDGSWGTIDASRPYQIYLDTQSSHQAFGGATSALGVMSLVEPSRTDPAAEASLQRGVEHLVTMPEVGKASGNTFYDIWTHTYMISALCRVVDDPRFAESRERIVAVIEREIDILRDRQGLDGGWGYYDFDYILENPSGDQSTSFNTAAVLLALEEARARGFEVDPRMVEDGIKAVERMRLPNGAYAYGTYAQYRPQAPFNMIKGSLGRSQPCNLSLHELERNITLEQMQAGVEALRRDHHYIEIGRGRKIPHEAYYSTSGYYYFFGHYYAGMVIEELEEPSRGELALWLQDVMIDVQDPAGSWFDYPLYGYGHPYGTAYGLLVLQSTHRSLASGTDAAGN
ncbi:MAG: prenyltransferase/squalene oxidase repeat-containing protein [Planctomycetota bacterium]|nr:prenyltransferase/squalene oxidase repeat-containing protein [Planctomycetota bacterium]